MILALGCLSGQGVWVLADARAERVIAAETWSDQNSTGLSVGITRHFERLFERAGRKPAEVTALFATTGPGAFTGLRMGGAYVQGLARGLGLDRAAGEVPVRGVPTFDLVGRPFWIPLRHQKARTLSLDEAIRDGLEFLEILGAQDFRVGAPRAGDTILGLRDHPDWPTPEQILIGVRAKLDADPGLDIVYGLEPKISGVRAAAT